MASRGNKKLWVFLALLAVFVLFVVGLATGEIGAKLGQALFNAGDGKGVLEQPKVVIPPEPLFPADAHHHFEEFLEFQEHPVAGEEEPKPFKSSWPMGFVISNTILSSWLTTLVLVTIFVVGMARPKLVPRGLQNVCEWAVEVLLNFCESVAGKEWGRRLLPVVATIFLFVAFNAWMGLLPIYPALGPIEGSWWSGSLKGHLLRPAGTDMNMPLAVALVAFVFIELQGFRALGAAYLSKFIRTSSLKAGVRGLLHGKPLDAAQGFIDFGFVGLLEAFSEFIRIVSFTFRLFGNMTAGEILVIMSAFLVSFVATVVVYGLEMFVGFVQALVFAGLTLVFATLAVAPHHAEEGEEAHH